MKSFWLGLLAWIFLFVFFGFFSQTSFAIDPSPTPVKGGLCFVDDNPAKPGTLTDFGCIPNDPSSFVQKFYGIGLGFIGGTALLVIIYGGYLLMTSKGNPDQIRSGKNAIYYSIAGVLLAIFGFVFIQVIAADVLKIPGFG